MNTEKLNHWLSLLANLGVLIGIVFLITEINQSNRIATNEAEIAVSERVMDVNRASAEYAELWAKLREESSNLNSAEIERARALVLLTSNYWGTADSAFRNGLIAQYQYDIYVSDVEAVMTYYPGVVPIFYEFSQLYSWENIPTLIFERVLSELAERGY